MTHFDLFGRRNGDQEGLLSALFCREYHRSWLAFFSVSRFKQPNMKISIRMLVTIRMLCCFTDITYAGRPFLRPFYQEIQKPPAL